MLIKIAQKKICTKKTDVSLVKMVSFTYSNYNFFHSNLVINRVGISIELKDTFLKTKAKAKNKLYFCQNKIKP